MFLLFTIILSMVAALIDGLLGYGDAYSFRSATSAGAGASSNGPVGVIVSIALFIPTLAVSFRRLHDTDRTAWWLLLSFLPILGWIVLLMFYYLDGTQGLNDYGPDSENPEGDLGEVFS